MSRTKITSICVYASSSDAVDAVYQNAATTLGALLAQRGLQVIYGAGNLGLMGALGEAIKAKNGTLIGVIPEKLNDLDLADRESTELVVTETMRERKAVMEARADAFIALPGGFGTLEEIMEVLTLKQLWYHDKPVIFLNVNGIYDGLLAFFDRLVAERFVKDDHQELFYVADTPEEAVAHLDGYTPPEPHGKWF